MHTTWEYCYYSTHCGKEQHIIMLKEQNFSGLFDRWFRSEATQNVKCCWVISIRIWFGFGGKKCVYVHTLYLIYILCAIYVISLCLSFSFSHSLRYYNLCTGFTYMWSLFVFLNMNVQKKKKNQLQIPWKTSEHAGAILEFIYYFFFLFFMR